MIRIYTGKAASTRTTTIVAILIVATFFVVGAIPKEYLLWRWIAMGFYSAGALLVLRYVSSFKSLKGACLVSEDGNAEKYFVDDVYTRTKHLNGATIVPINTKPTELSCSLFWAEDGKATKCTLSIKVVPDINNLQVYVDTLHRNKPAKTSAIALAIFQELQRKFSADKIDTQCTCTYYSCTEEAARSIFCKCGFALQSFNHNVTQAELLIE